MKRFVEIKNTIRHRKEVQRIAKSLGYSFPMHDFVKMINTFIFGDKIATELHRAFSSHHAQVIGYLYKLDSEGKEVRIGNLRDIENKVEAAIDWESARFTKPEKPLNAYQTWKKYYSDIDMEDTLKQLGFWEE